MSAGIEPLKTSIRIWWKIDGKRHRETLYNTPPTANNIKEAQATADMISQQIRMGIFDRNQVFPNSPKRPESYFGHYIGIWKRNEVSTVSPTSWQTYLSKVENHIQPYWSKKQIAKITTEDFEHWVYKVLQKRLAPKTIRDIIMLWHTIWGYWARKERNPSDPTAYIKLSSNDSEDINPFSKDEIATIINSETDPTLKNLWTVMLWSGLSSHELIPLAVEDLALENGCLYVRRGFVKGLHKATKNRRRKRQVELLPIVIDALANQQNIVQANVKQSIEILNRDNITKETQYLTWLWYDPNRKTHYNYAQLEKRWMAHLSKCHIAYRSLNNGRHTYASQVLSSGAVSAEWLANQLGHANTEMIHKHYGKFIPQDARHIIDRLNQAIHQS